MPVTRQENADYGEYVNQLAAEMGVFDFRDQEVWHYTDGNGFLGILQSGTMFATQVSALNDSKETQYGTDLFKDAVNAVKAERIDDAQSGTFLETVLELVKEEPSNPTQGVSKFFVTCFSSSKDDLNQWSKYQKASAGRYAIGFYPNGLNREPNSTLYRVIYDKSKQEEAAKKVVEAMLGFYEKGLIGERPAAPEQWSRDFFLAWNDWIYKLSPLVKSSAWESEQECRIVHELKVAEFPRVRFAQKKTMLARYLPLDFPCWVKERTSRLPIKSVMIGPGENLVSTKVSAMLLLEQMGYPQVQVDISACTLTDR
jgi:hypothetical protein